MLHDTGRILFKSYKFKLLLGHSDLDYVEPLLNHTSSTAK